MTTYLLDTTVLVDLGRRRLETRRWWLRQDRTEMFVSTITIGELYRGAFKRHGGDATALDEALQQIDGAALRPFDGRILAFDRAAAERWGRLVGVGERAGRRPPTDDAKIAAIALVHGMTVATSNPQDFSALCPTIDPRAA